MAPIECVRFLQSPAKPNRCRDERRRTVHKTERAQNVREQKTKEFFAGRDASPWFQPCFSSGHSVPCCNLDISLVQRNAKETENEECVLIIYANRCDWTTESSESNGIGCRRVLRLVNLMLCCVCVSALHRAFILLFFWMLHLVYAALNCFDTNNKSIPCTVFRTVPTESRWEFSCFWGKICDDQICAKHRRCVEKHLWRRTKTA